MTQAELDDKLQALDKAQRDLYDYLGVTRREADDAGEFHRATFYAHSTGLYDISVAYPEVMDYRHNKWRIADSVIGQGQEEVQVLPLDVEDWGSERIIHFHIYTIKDGEGDDLIHLIGNHLPKPHELEYSFPDKVVEVEDGGFMWGDRCYLLLDPRKGYTDLEEYKEYFL